MRVYEAKLVYEATLFEVGATALNSAELVYEYMKDTLEVYSDPGGVSRDPAQPEEPSARS